ATPETHRQYWTGSGSASPASSTSSWTCSWVTPVPDDNRDVIGSPGRRRSTMKMRCEAAVSNNAPTAARLKRNGIIGARSTRPTALVGESCVLHVDLSARLLPYTGEFGRRRSGSDHLQWDQFRH